MKKTFLLSTFAVILVLAAPFSVLANGSADQTGDDTLNIGITKIVIHPALDSLEQGVMDVVLESYPAAVFDNQNANGDMSTASSIAQKFKSDGVDLAIGIATPTAQALANVIKDVPVVFCAVTDPVDAGLVPSLQQSAGNVTGVSDMTPVRDQIELLASMINLKAIGHVYSSGEANAVRLAEVAEEACNELGIEFVGTSVSNSSEVKQAAQAIAGRVDAFYVSTDNTVVSALSALTDTATSNRIPVLSADTTSAAENGVFLAWGFDYYKMGRVTGALVVEILGGKKPADIPTRFMTSVEDIDLFLNLDVAKELGITVPKDLQDKAATMIVNGEVVMK